MRRKFLREGISNNMIFAIRYIMKKTQKVVFLLLIMFMVAGSVLPQKANKVYAYDSSVEESTDITDETTIEYPTTTDDDFDYSQVELSSEVVSERTESTKTFLREDGSYVVAMYDDVIHYEDNGEFKNIDNSLIYNDTSDEYSNKENKFSIKFPKKLDDNKSVKLVLGDYRVDWSIQATTEAPIIIDNTDITASSIKELTNVTQKVSYLDIMNDVDIEYYVNGSNVKEDIILNKYIEDFSITFEYSIKNLVLINDNGRIRFVNESGTEIFNFSDLYAYDSNGEITYDIDINVEEIKKDEYQISINPDDNWLKSASYPVVIDPTINSSTQSIYIQDTYVYQGSPRTNYSTASTMIVSGVDDVFWYKSLLKFNLPSALANKSITYANLKLTEDSGTTGREIVLRKNTSSYINFRVNWSNAPTFDSEIIDYHIIGNDDEYIFNITKTVKEWQDGDANNGFTIMDKGVFNAFNSIRTSEYTGTTSSPVVEIGYIDPTGIKDYWTYTSQSAGKAGTGYVSDYTGLLTFLRNDVNFSTERNTLDLTMVYNVSNSQEDIGYGLGWQTNYNMKVELDTYLELYYAIDSTGSKVYYHYDGMCYSTSTNDYPTYLVQRLSSTDYGEVYLAEDGSGQLLMVCYNSLNVVIGSYILASDFTLHYYTHIVNGVFYLEKIRSNLSSTNKTTISISRDSYYPDRIVGIGVNTNAVESTGNFIHLDYTSGRLSTASLYLYLTDAPTYSASEKITYVYTEVEASSGNYGLTTCTSFKDYDIDSTWTTDNIVNYSYDTSGRLEQAYESNGEKIVYDYSTTSDKIISIERYYASSLFSELTYVYDFKKTVITDEAENYIINKFDDYGHTVNIIDSMGTSQSFSYINLFKDVDYDTTEVLTLLDGTPNYANNNKLYTESIPQNIQKEYLSNPGFEYSFTDPYDGWSDIALETGSDGTLSRNTSSPLPKVELYSAKINTSNSYGAYITQTVVLDAGTYTLSGFVYNATTNLDDVYIDLILPSGSYGTAEGVATAFSQWDLVSKNFVIEADNSTVTIKLANYGIGYACFDGIQITEGFGVSRLNLMENSSFEYAYSSTSIPEWSTLGTGVTRVQSTFDSDIYEEILGDYAIQIDGSATSSRSISNTNNSFLNYYITEGTILVGAWAKSEGTPTSSQPTDVYDRFFRIKVSTYNASSVLIDDIYIYFDTSVEGWQFNLGTIGIDSTVSSIVTSLEYQGEGNVYFDNITMYFEPAFTTYNYDSAGRITSIVKPSQQEELYGYADDTADDDFTRIPETISVDGFESVIVSDAEVIESITTNNIKMTPSFNDYGQLYSTVIGEGTTDYYSTSTTYLQSSYYQYVSATTDEFGKTTNYYNDIYTGLLEAVENANGQDTHYLYDDIGNLVEVISTEDFDDSLSLIDGKVAYAYDSQNRLTKICLEYSNRNSPTYYYEIFYDSQGRMENIKVNTSNLITYTYDDGATYYSDEILTETYGNGDSMQFVYNEFDQVIETQFLIAPATYETRFSYEYSTDGYLNVYTEWDGINVVNREFYSYDSSGRITKIIDEEDNVVEYGYDELGNVSSIYYKIDDIDNGTDYLYDDEYRISETTYTTLASNFLKRGYDYTESTDLDRLDNIRLHINVTANALYTENFTYQDYTSRITDITYDFWERDDENFKFSYQYDDIGNITQIIYLEKTVEIRKDNYEYDDLNQLIVEDISYSDIQVEDYTNVYQYDQRGNRTSVSKYDYQRDGLDQPQYSLDYDYSTTWLDQVDSYDIIVEEIEYLQEIVSYDVQGNPLEITNFMYIDFSGSTYVYDHADLDWEGRTLNSITIKNGSNVTQATITYTYNDHGYRTSKTITEGTTTEVTYYDLLEDKVLHESDGTSDIYYTYDSDGTLISFNEDGDDYFYLYNLQGDVIALIDDTGSTVVKYSYDAYGNVMQPATNNNPYTYRGYRYDSEIDMYYLNSRYYNPHIGRFINSDGLLGTSAEIISTNMYAYCQNNPVIFIDPSGYRMRTFSEYVVDSVTSHTVNYYGSALPYIEYKSSGMPPNCYGYSIARFSDLYLLQPGQLSTGQLLNERLSDISLVEGKIFDDFEEWGRSIRRIGGANAPINSNEYRIALRVITNKTANIFGTYDYHFIVQTNDGRWASKSRYEPSVLLPFDINPSNYSWYGIYDSEIRYYAVTLP
jgi:RHS repeat-associated protein